MPTVYVNVTDGQTDRRTDGRTDGRHTIAIPRLHYVHRAVKMYGCIKCHNNNIIIRQWATDNSKIFQSIDTVCYIIECFHCIHNVVYLG